MNAFNALEAAWAKTPRDDESEGGGFGGSFAGWSFDSEAALVEHIETMKPQGDGGKLQTSDALLLFHLVLQDEDFSRISQPIRCVRKNSHGESRFSAELEDGSWMEIPWQRALQVLASRKRESRLDGTKKMLDHLPQISDCWETGQILEIRGLREGTTFSMVRSALTHFGQVPYVEVLRIPPGARRSQNDFNGSKADEAPTATARCRFEDAVACGRAAKELKEVAGAPVRAFVLNGEAEVAYQHRVQRKRRRNRKGLANDAKFAKKKPGPSCCVMHLDSDFTLKLDLRSSCLAFNDLLFVFRSILTVCKRWLQDMRAADVLVVFGYGASIGVVDSSNKTVVSFAFK
eukprot:s1168_g26.t1